jgi:hypothetical protein
MGWTNGGRFTAKVGIFLFAIAFRFSRPPRPPILWIPEVFSLGPKRTERVAKYPCDTRLWRRTFLKSNAIPVTGRGGP